MMKLSLLTLSLVAFALVGQRVSATKLTTKIVKKRVADIDACLAGGGSCKVTAQCPSGYLATGGRCCVVFAGEPTASCFALAGIGSNDPFIVEGFTSGTDATGYFCNPNPEVATLSLAATTPSATTDLVAVAACIKLLLQ
eukprot:TRINITY_DN27250_c0_g1_i1.p1 TRINITY_DN27250_c0_g1~~TRINITY_DN27250_c0_g1_i1.p1  ORF type:complete len:140 (+),score=17.93 TRINITY_DN27250_c0_g1_i1:359-778(+)